MDQESTRTIAQVMKEISELESERGSIHRSVGVLNAQIEDLMAEKRRLGLLVDRVEHVITDVRYAHNAASVSGFTGSNRGRVEDHLSNASDQMRIQKGVHEANENLIDSEIRKLTTLQDDLEASYANHDKFIARLNEELRQLRRDMILDV